MADWSIKYVSNSLYGAGIHAGLFVYNGDTPVATFQGLATAPDGAVAPIGLALLGYKLQGYVDYGDHVFGPSIAPGG